MKESHAPSGEGQRPVLPTIWRWTGTTDHPRQLTDTLRLALEQAGFMVDVVVEGEPKREVLGEVADFDGSISGVSNENMSSALKRKWPWLALGVLLLPVLVGLLLIRYALRPRTYAVQLSWRGEMYEAAASSERRGESRESESRARIVSDVRLELGAAAIEPKPFGGQSTLTGDETLEAAVSSLIADLQRLLGSEGEASSEWTAPRNRSEPSHQPDQDQRASTLPPQPAQGPVTSWPAKAGSAGAEKVSGRVSRRAATMGAVGAGVLLVLAGVVSVIFLSDDEPSAAPYRGIGIAAVPTAVVATQAFRQTVPIETSRPVQASPPVQASTSAQPSRQLTQDTDGDGVIDSLDLFPSGNGVVWVTILSFKELTAADPFLPGDPYFVIQVAGTTQRSITYDNTSELEDLGPFEFDLSDDRRQVEVRVEAWDQDGNEDDRYDISSEAGSEAKGVTVSVTFDRLSGAVTVSGDGTLDGSSSGPQAAVTVRVESVVLGN